MSDHDEVPAPPGVVVGSEGGRADGSAPAALLLSALEATADGILVVDPGRKIIAFNQTFLDLWQIPPHVIEPRDDAAAVTFVKDQLADPEGFVRRIAEIYSAPSDESRDRIRCRDGRVFDRFSRPLTLDGRPAGRVWSTRDVSRRVADEQSIRLSAERYRAIFEKDLAANSISTPEGRLIDCNEPFWRMFAFGSRDAALACELDDLFPSRAAREEVVELIRRRSSVTAHEMTMRRIDGTLIAVVTNGIGVFDDQGGLVEIHGHGFDVTDRKRVEAELRRREELFRTLVERAPDQITLLDADGVIRFESPAVRHLLGYEPEEMVGRPGMERVHPDDLPAMREGLAWKLAHPGRPWPFSCRYRHKDGTWRDFEGVSTNLLDNPAVGGFVVNSRDVTDRKRDERLLRESEERLRQSQKMEAVGRLAGGVAHDFNNLLTVIGGYADLLLGGLAEGTPERESAEEIRRAAERAAGLTAQLLAFGRRQVAAPKPIDLNVVVRDTRKMLGRLIGEDVEIAEALAEGLGRVRADPGQITQVIVNLAVNARDAMPRGGRVLIATANVDQAEASPPDPPAVFAGPFVRLSVGDTGTGIAPEVRRRLFEPFFTTKPVGQGTGLGLATVYGIVQQSGGHLSVTAELGGGTTFAIYLPRLDADASVTASLPKPDPVPRGSERVLVVEDEPAVRGLAVAILRGCGYDVTHAGGGPEALALFASRPIDLLVADVVMPGMGGPELAAEARSSRPALKVLFLSGYGDGVSAKGHAEVLPKPFDAESLPRKVREVLDAP